MILRITTPYTVIHHHRHISVTQLGQLLTRSGLTYPEVSSKVYHDSFSQLGSSVSLPWVIYFEAFYLTSRGIPCSHKRGNNDPDTAV